MNKNLAIANRSRVSCAHNMSRAPFLMTLNDLVFKVTPVFDTEYLTNGYTDTATVTIEGE